MPTCKFTKKSLACILPSFSKNASRLLFSEEVLKLCEQNSFRKYQQKVVLLVIYLFNYSSSESTYFTLNVAFDFITLVRSSSSKLEFIAIKVTKTLFFSYRVFWYVVLFNKKLIALHHADILCYSILKFVLNSHFRQ